MLVKKQRIFRLLENQINDFFSDDIRIAYGDGSKIKIGSISESLKSKIMLIEGVVILGSEINDDVLDPLVAEIVIEDISVYLFPRHTIESYVRFDV